MANKFSLPYGIDFVVEQDLSTVKKYYVPGGYDIKCPFCGGFKKLNINTTKSLWRCAKCDESGNAITLHAKLLKITNKEAYSDLKKRFLGIPVEERKVFEYTEPENIVTPLPVSDRNRVYTRLIKQLKLDQQHINDLLDRGLTIEQIEANQYRTLPISSLSALGEYCCEPVAGCPKDYGLPGFYDLQSSPKLVKRKNGFLIPCKTLDGKISGFQIRHDNLPEKATSKQKERYHKYSWLTSSEKETGCTFSGCENIHFAGDWSQVPEVINLTEGVLKADIATALSGKLFMGLAGVNNVSQLKDTLKILKKRGAKRVNIALDMDYREKPEVAKAMKNITNIIRNTGFGYTLIKWPSEYKGIDDFLLARKKTDKSLFSKGIKSPEKKDENA